MNMKIALAFADDEIEELGDKIASLTKKEAIALSNYLATTGIIWPFDRK